MKWFLTKQPVGSQHFLGFGNALDQTPFAFDSKLLLAWSFSMKFTISTQRLIRGSCNGLYNSTSDSLQPQRSRIGNDSKKSSLVKISQTSCYTTFLIVICHQITSQRSFLYTQCLVDDYSFKNGARKQAASTMAKSENIFFFFPFWMRPNDAGGQK